jgi:hypothetical protein
MIPLHSNVCFFLFSNFQFCDVVAKVEANPSSTRWKKMISLNLGDDGVNDVWTLNTFKHPPFIVGYMVEPNLKVVGSNLELPLSIKHELTIAIQTSWSLPINKWWDGCWCGFTNIMLTFIAKQMLKKHCHNYNIQEMCVWFLNIVIKLIIQGFLW